MKNKIQHDPNVEVLIFLEVLWHSKVRVLEMSGHLFTILCTLVSGFVFDFPKAGAQEVKLKCIDFLFK